MKALPLVLMIDDQETDRYILRSHLDELAIRLSRHRAKKGFSWSSAETGFDFVDLNMPGMDGFEVLSRLAEGPATAPLPVTIVTSQILVPEQYQALTHARSVILKHELSPAVWQRVFREAGLEISR